MSTGAPDAGGGKEKEILKKEGKGGQILKHWIKFTRTIIKTRPEYLIDWS